MELGLVGKLAVNAGIGSFEIFPLRAPAVYTGSAAGLNIFGGCVMLFLQGVGIKHSILWIKVASDEVTLRLPEPKK
jgi:hypothetical protein